MQSHLDAPAAKERTLPSLLDLLPDPFRPWLNVSTLSSLHRTSKALRLVTSKKLAEGLKIDLTRQGV